MFVILSRTLVVLIAVTAGVCLNESVQEPNAGRAESLAVEFLKREVPAWVKNNG